jgi:hypothetical protein
LTYVVHGYSNPIQYERNRWFAYLVHSVGGNASAETLPCVGLGLNASKPESMLERDVMFFVCPASCRACLSVVFHILVT